MGAGELDRCFDALAAGTREERFAELATGALAQQRAELTGKLRDAGLEHRGAVALEFRDDRRFDQRMIMANVVNAVAGIKIENRASVVSLQFGAETAAVSHVHLQHIE